MSLYTNAAKAISNPEKKGGSLKSRIYNDKSLHHPPHQIYALIGETIKWSPVLKEVIEKSELLKDEKKLNPVLATLLVHDHLLSKRGINTSPNHPLHSAILRHKARLNAEFTKIRIRRGFANLDAFRQNINEVAVEDVSSDSESPKDGRHPRWVRVNTLKTTVEQQIKSTFASYTECKTLMEILKSKGDSKLFMRDLNIENLLALPPGHDISKFEAYKRGELIIQDKASCFPAYLLDPTCIDGDVIDACAAPGNKTTHLAAILKSGLKGSTSRKVFAFEKDKNRTMILQKMVGQAGANNVVKIYGSSDFLTTKPSDFESVSVILLDPSCSGSGIVGRDDGPKLQLPTSVITQPVASRKRKREEEPKKSKPIKPEENGDEEAQAEAEADSLKKRLESLSAFQLRLLRHAMSFPTVRRIVYSTCSIHKDENEFVVVKALSQEKSWRLMRREEQVEGLREWPVRGDEDACTEGLDVSEARNDLPNPSTIADSCIRCNKSSNDGTIGFFVVGFVRENNTPSNVELSDEEWAGFSDGE